MVYNMATDNEQKSEPVAPDRGRYPIRTVVRMTGINPVTLRAWESRYGLVHPERTPSGHRLYTRAQIDRIQRAMDMVRRGIPIGQVRAVLEREAGAALAPEAGGGAWAELIGRALRAVHRFDRVALNQVYEDALAVHPVAKVTDLFILPLLRHLGQHWLDEEAGIAEEHFFTTHLRNRLGSRLMHTPARERDVPLVVACLPGEHHETGLLLFALEASGQGFRPVVLGPDVPLEQVGETARRLGCPVVLSGTMKPRRGLLTGELPQLAKTLRQPVFIGGPVTVGRGAVLGAAGLIPVGSDIGMALALIRRRLAA